MWVYNSNEQVAANPLGGYRVAIGSDQAFANATGGTAAAITGLSFPIRANETWSYAVNLLTTGVSGGGKVSISTPASPSLVSMTSKGVTNGATAFSTDTVTAVDTLGAAYNTTAITAMIEIKGLVVNGVTAGNVTFNAANVTNSNSFTVKAGSTLVATRIA